MNRLLLALGVTLIATLALAQQRTAPAPNAEAYFISPQNGAMVHGPVTIRFGLKGMGIAPAGVNFENTGRHHVIIDTGFNEWKLEAQLPASSKTVHLGMGQTQP